MPPAITPVPPWALKEILVAYGFRVVFEDDYNWIFDEPSHSEIEPLLVPKIGDVVAVDVMMDTLVNARMTFGAYQTLKDQVLGAKWHSLGPDDQDRVKKNYSH
jgi:hypothetical protein